MPAPSLWATKSWPSAVSVEVSANETLARLSPGRRSTGPKTSASSPTSAPPGATGRRRRAGGSARRRRSSRTRRAGPAPPLVIIDVLTAPSAAFHTAARAARRRRRRAGRPSGRRRRRSRASAPRERPARGTRRGRSRAARRARRGYGGRTSSRPSSDPSAEGCAGSRADGRKDLSIRHDVSASLRRSAGPAHETVRVELDAYERRFRRAGLPLFIEGWNASEDVFTRAVPLFALVFVGEVLGALDRDWSLWANLAAAARRAGDPALRLRPAEPGARAPLLRAAAPRRAARARRSS